VPKCTHALRSTIAVAVLVLLGGASGAQQRTPRITGSVVYRERVALTGEAVLEVTLEDTSRADAPATVIARRSMSNPGQVPIAFELPFDPAQIATGRRYAVRARIIDRGVLAFISTQAYLVDLESPPSPLTILVEPARGPAAAAAEPAIEDVDWVLTQVFGRAVPFSVDTMDARLRLLQAQQRLQGSTGCNNIVGSYERRESQLAFKGVAATRMACAPPTMDQETQVLKALEATAAWRLADGKLQLLDAGGMVIAQLVPPR
jgi:putative lipoprotein